MTRLGFAALRRIGVAVGIAAAVAVLAAALAPAESAAQGCAMCGTYLANGADPRSEAFKISIIFLMCMPFLTILSAGGWIVWMHWRTRPQHPMLRAVITEEEGV